MSACILNQKTNSFKFVKYFILLCREEELPELEQLIRANQCPHAPKGGVENKQGKANILIQVDVQPVSMKPVSATVTHSLSSKHSARYL